MIVITAGEEPADEEHDEEEPESAEIPKTVNRSPRAPGVRAAVRVMWDCDWWGCVDGGV